MPKFQGETDKVLKVKLTSTLLAVRWDSDHVSQSGTIPLEVLTSFVADNSTIQITIKDAEGKTIETLKGKVHSNCFRLRYPANKPNKTGGMFFEAELPDHNLKGMSGKVAVLPPTRVTEPKWLTSDPKGDPKAEKKEPKTIHPGERYTLQAKVDAIPGKADAMIGVLFLKNPDADPVPFRTLGAKVKDGKVEVQWEIPSDFGRPTNVHHEDDKDPAFQFEVVYVGASILSAPMPYIPSKVMTVIEVEDALFNHDSAVFLPSAPMGPGHNDGGPAPQDASHASSGLGIVASLFRHVDQHPDKKLVIAGHTDTSGGVAYNFTLSGKRAEAVLSVIVNDRDKWKSTCHGQQKVEDFQQILSHYHDLLGWDCDPQGTDGTLGEHTRHALAGFRSRYNSEKEDMGFGSSPDLPESALAGNSLKAEYWGGFFDMYQWELAQGLSTDIAGLDAFRNKVQFVDGGKKFVPCGESFPIQRPDRSNFRSQTNRRIEMLLFDPGEEPTLSCPASRSTVHTAVECPVYGLQRYIRVFIAPLWLLRFKVVDEDDEIVEVQRPLKFEVKDREGRSAQTGTFKSGVQVMFFGDPLEHYTVFVEGGDAAHLIGAPVLLP